METHVPPSTSGNGNSQAALLHSMLQGTVRCRPSYIPIILLALPKRDRLLYTLTWGAVRYSRLPLFQRTAPAKSLELRKSEAGLAVLLVRHDAEATCVLGLRV